MNGVLKIDAWPEQIIDKNRNWHKTKMTAEIIVKRRKVRLIKCSH